MVVLTLIMLLLGLAFAFFGYRIGVKGQYGLINGFDPAAATPARKAFARRLGVIELAAGIAYILAAIAAFFLGEFFAWAAFCLLLAATLIALAIHTMGKPKKSQ